MSDAAKRNEKRGGTVWGGPAGNKGEKAKPGNQFDNYCNKCGGRLPCNDEECLKARGKTTWQMRRDAKQQKQEAKAAKIMKKLERKNRKKK